MACPGCLVAVAGTDGLGDSSSSSGSFVAGALLGGLCVWVATFLIKDYKAYQKLGPDPHEVFRQNRRRRRSRRRR